MRVTIYYDDYDTKFLAAAVWPRDPILLPRLMAVVEGQHGQPFMVREHKEELLGSSSE